MIRFFIFSCLLFSPLALSHPVIYKGGSVYWGTFTPSAATQRVSYSFHPRFSIEAKSTTLPSWKNYFDTTLGMNSLVKRWFFHDSQANLYAGVQLGGYRQTKKPFSLLVQSQLSADWESRKLYTALNITSFYLAKENEHVQKLSYRAGFAPHLGGMDDLHTWMVFQLDYFNGVTNQLSFTPLMRFFYNNALWEIGANLQGHFFLTLMVHN